MKAEEARKLTAEAAQSGDLTKAWLLAIYQKIKAAAEAGKREINHPFQGVRLQMPTKEQADAIWYQLGRDGYDVQQHPDPDPGHPASGPYTSISW